MDSWLKISILLCIFGFFREFRPHEPFAVEFFVKERNISIERLTNHFFPIGTYLCMLQLIVIFLITDFLKYKPVIICSAIFGMTFCALMAWTESATAIYFVQLFYGAFVAAEVAYYTYIYAKVDKAKYQLVTGHTRAAILAGRFLGATISQVLISVSFFSAKYVDLVVFSFATQCVSLVFAILLPSVETSMYFYAKDAVNDKPQEITIATIADKQLTNVASDPIAIENGKNRVAPAAQDAMPKLSFTNAIKRIKDHVITSYSDTVVIQWSILWTFSMCGFLQVQSYIQSLWNEISPAETDLYNGAVEAAITLLGAMSAFAAGLLDSKRFNRYDVWILTVLTFGEAMLLLWAAYTPSLWSCYVSYVVFGIIYHFMITVASATIAKRLHEDCFALIFGINTLIALTLQSLLTFVVITQMDLPLRVQYKLYGYLFFVLTVFYGVLGTSRTFFTQRKSCDLV